MAGPDNSVSRRILYSGLTATFAFLCVLIAPPASLAHGGGHGGGGGGGHCGGGGGHCGSHSFSGGHVGGFTGGHFGCSHPFHSHFSSHGFSSSNASLSNTSIFNSNLQSSTLPASVNTTALPADADAAALGVGALTPEEELINQRAKRVGFFGHLHRMFRGGPTP